MTYPYLPCIQLAVKMPIQPMKTVAGRKLW
jgi:hypothetical protein